MKRVLILVMVMVMVFSVSVSAKTAEINSKELPSNVIVIDKSEVPDGIEPLKFDSMDEYKEYLKKVRKTIAVNEKGIDISNENPMVMYAFPVLEKTHSQKVYNALVDVFAYVNYSYRYDDNIGDIVITGINYKYIALSGMSAAYAKFEESLFLTTMQNNSREIDVVVAGSYSTYAEVALITLVSYDDVEYSYTINP
jgi:hypothetical protein